MQQILYLIQKEFRQVFRDKPMLAIIFFAPLVQMVVLGFAITVDVKHIQTIIVDYDSTPASHEIVRKFENNTYFEVIPHQAGQGAVRESIDAWRAQMAIIIPHQFARDLAQLRYPQIQVITDGLDGNTAGIALGYAQGLLMEYALSLNAQAMPVQQLKLVSLVQPLIRMWYNLDLESRNYMVPGLIAVLLTLISMFLSSMGLVREKELGTLEQLMVTPIKTWQLILGKVLPFLLLAFGVVNILHFPFLFFIRLMVKPKKSILFPCSIFITFDFSLFILTFNLESSSFNLFITLYNNQFILG